MLSRYSKLIFVIFTFWSSISLAQFCDGFPYMTINSATSADIVRVVIQNDSIDLQQICNTGLEINAIGMDSISEEMIAWDDPGDRLVSVNNTCQVTEIPLTGTFDATPRYLLGDISQDGSTYVAWRSGSLADFIVVDMTNSTASSVTISSQVTMSDWAFGSDGLLYGVNKDDDLLTTIDPATGIVTATSVSVPDLNGGAVWFDLNGDFWLYEQSIGVANQVKIGTGNGEVVKFFGGVLASGADGGACASTLPPPILTPVSVPTLSIMGLLLMMIIFSIFVIPFLNRNKLKS